jgi:hypothetical protein
MEPRWQAMEANAKRIDRTITGKGKAYENVSSSVVLGSYHYHISCGNRA